MSSIESRNNFQQEETPEEIRKRLEEEESQSRLLKSMENPYERVSGKLRRIEPRVQMERAKQQAREKAEIDAEQRRLNEVYTKKPQDEGVEIKMKAGKRGRVEFRQNKVA